MQHDGSLLSRSAFAFESMCGRLRKDYQAGTSTVGKQGISNMLLQTATSTNHHCSESILPSTHETLQKKDSPVYTSKNGKFDFYKIVEHRGSDFSVHKKVSEPFQDKTLPWEPVGVFKFICTPLRTVHLSRNAITRKAIIVSRHIMTILVSMLTEPCCMDG